MATHSSAEKAHRQNLKRRAANRNLRSRLRTALKDIRAAIDGGDLSTAHQQLKGTLSLIDKMSGKGIIHDNTAGRYKSRIVRHLSKTSATA